METAVYRTAVPVSVVGTVEKPGHRKPLSWAPAMTARPEQALQRAVFRHLAVRPAPMDRNSTRAQTIEPERRPA
jgi:hypothetical protein